MYAVGEGESSFGRDGEGAMALFVFLLLKEGVLRRGTTTFLTSSYSSSLLSICNTDLAVVGVGAGMSAFAGLGDRGGSVADEPTSPNSLDLRADTEVDGGGRPSLLVGVLIGGLVLGFEATTGGPETRRSIL